MKRTLHILFAALAAMMLLPATMRAIDVDYEISGTTLTIKGEGPMEDYTDWGECPWYEDFDAITEIVIEEGITHIGDYAFEDAKEVTSVTLPSTLKSIGIRAFAYMSSLTEINIPATVTTIGDCAFVQCFALTSVTFNSPTPPEFYGTDFFSDCENLRVYVNGSPDGYLAWSIEHKIPVFSNSVVKSKKISDEEFDLMNNVLGERVDELTYTRTLPNTLWNALIVPFEIPVTASFLENYDVAYINDIHSSDSDEDGEIDVMEMEIVKIKEGTLKANYPYLIRAKNDAAKAVSLVLENATHYPAFANSIECSSVFTTFTIYGTYTERKADELEGCYAISTTGAWQELAEGTSLKPCRLYLEMNDRSGSPVKLEAVPEIRIRVAGEDSEATAIEEVETETADENVIFDLMGRRVAAPVKGQIYIVNGKKVLF